MAHLEIEKRFLCKTNLINNLKKNSIHYTIAKLEQFYLVANIQETLRYRKEDNIYIKNQKKGSGLVREEKEERVSKKEYKIAKKENCGGVIKKRRYKFLIDGMLYELDIFSGKLKGLAILEIEFKNIEDAKNYKPPKFLKDFIIKDITQESIYSNGALSKSMQIPLRKDSYLSLKDSKKTQNPNASLSLYISEYENSRYALNNSIKELLISFKYNYKEFKAKNEIDYLIKANRALDRIKTLIKYHKKYIKTANFSSILFNINNILLIFETTIQTHLQFKTLLKNKEKKKIKTSTKILKELIDIATKEKKLRANLIAKDINKEIKALKNSLKNIKFNKIDKPFYYIKEKLLSKAKKSIKKTIAKAPLEMQYKKLKELKTLHLYFKEDFTIEKEYKVIKKVYRFNSCLEKLEDKKLRSICKTKKIKKEIIKKIKMGLLNGN